MAITGTEACALVSSQPPHMQPRQRIGLFHNPRGRRVEESAVGWEVRQLESGELELEL
uniref:Uncharacterized protein n=1 Tax=Setaria digitata TaxID=48799 RepID=A0A915Q1W8_9BILA